MVLTEDAATTDYVHGPPSPLRVGAGTGPGEAPGASNSDVLSSTAVRLLADLVHHADPSNKVAAEAQTGTPGTLGYLDSKSNQRFVYMLRGCDTFDGIDLAPTLLGRKLYDALLALGEET